MSLQAARDALEELSVGMWEGVSPEDYSQPRVYGHQVRAARAAIQAIDVALAQEYRCPACGSGWQPGGTLVHQPSCSVVALAQEDGLRARIEAVILRWEKDFDAGNIRPATVSIRELRALLADTLPAEPDGLRARIEWEGEWCKRCGQPNFVGFHVPTEVWKAVVGDEGAAWCVTCFTVEAARKDVAWASSINFYPVDTKGGASVYEKSADTSRTDMESRSVQRRKALQRGEPDTLPAEPEQTCPECGGTGMVWREDEMEPITPEINLSRGPIDRTGRFVITRPGDVEPCPACQVSAQKEER